MFKSSYMIHCFHVHVIDVRMHKCYFRNARTPRDLSCPRVEVSAIQISLATFRARFQIIGLLFRTADAQFPTDEIIFSKFIQ